MESSVQEAFNQIDYLVEMNNFNAQFVREILLEFYKQRTVEILGHLEEQGVGDVINYHNLKIGGSNNDD